MTTHFAPFTDLDDIEQAPCGIWLGESSELSGDWTVVDCRLCLKRKSNITKAVADEERAIVEQMGEMADFMRAEGSARKRTPVLLRCNPSPPYSFSEN